MDKSRWIELLSDLLKMGIVAIATYLGTSELTLASQQLMRVNAQLNDLYLPLRAKLEANDQTWNEFVKNRLPGRKVIFDGSPLTKQEIETWRNFMRNTFQKQNREMSEIITKNTDLLVDGRLPTMFKLVISHTEAYNAVIAQWKDTVSSDPISYTAKENTTLVNFPDSTKLHKCLDEEIAILKEYQSKLNSRVNKFFVTVHERVPEVCDEGR